MFGRKKKTEPEAEAVQKAAPAVTPEQDQQADPAPEFDPIGGNFGPFDGDSVDFRTFDFSDFAKGGLDLGSMLIPVPHEGEVQVEMGPNGPQMIHIVTPVGRVTPVAFAAPRNGDLWGEAAQEIAQGMSNDGMTVSVEQGPWGEEIVAEAPNGAMRILGANGPRWMFRLTLAGPKESAAQLTELAREITSRTFINRGSDPIPAGEALPVKMPQAMADELSKQLQARAEAAAEAADESAGNTGGQNGQNS